MDDRFSPLKIITYIMIFLGIAAILMFQNDRTITIHRENIVNEVYNKAQSGYTVIVDGIEVKSGLSKDIINSGIYGKTYFVDDEGKQIIVSLSK